MPKERETAPQRGAALQAISQTDLFVALPGDLPTHDQQGMNTRLLSLPKDERTDYHLRNCTTDVRHAAKANAGSETIWEADVLIWAASQVRVHTFDTVTILAHCCAPFSGAYSRTGVAQCSSIQGWATNQGGPRSPQTARIRRYHA